MALPSLLLVALLAPLAHSASTLSKRVTLVLCPDVATCADEMMWMAGLQSLSGDSLLLADTVLELDAQGYQNGVPAEDRFKQGIAKAREDLAQRRWASADGALEDARLAIERWNGTASNQDLFDLYFLRGALRVLQGQSGTDSFRQAAALTWNRSVVFPMEDEALLEAYYGAQRSLLEEGTGTLTVESALPDAEIFLDGVPLGPAPVEVRAFPGRHRLTATQGPTTMTWKKDLYIRAGEAAQAQARFDRSSDAAWVYDQLVLALSFRTMDPAVATLLADWARQQNVTLIRLAEAERLDKPRAKKPPKKAKKPAKKADPPPPEQEVVLGGIGAGDGFIPTYEEPVVPQAPLQFDVGDVGERRYRLIEALYDPQLRRFIE